MKKVFIFYGFLFLALLISQSSFSAEMAKNVKEDEIKMPERFT